MSNKVFLIVALILCGTLTWGQNPWFEFSKEIAEVEIKSSADGSMQKAMLYKSSKEGQPLIVHLHSWSASYLKTQPVILEQIRCLDYNYIYPDFRGSNNRPEACGSDLAISDIEDAISFALEKTAADRLQVHIIGSSGGGHASLMCYMRLTYPVRSFSAWVPITDLEAWYWEVLGRGYDNYAENILNVTSSGTTLDVAEARRRSPLFCPYPANLRKGASVSIYAGIHDGYTADVPITQSIYMYNKIVKEKYPNDKNAIVPDRDILEMLTKRSFPEVPPVNIGNRKLHYHKRISDVELVIFEGGHEMLSEYVFDLMPIGGEVRHEP